MIFDSINVKFSSTRKYFQAWLRLPADDKATQRRKVSKRSDAILPPATEEMSGEEGTTERQDQVIDVTW